MNCTNSYMDQLLRDIDKDPQRWPLITIKITDKMSTSLIFFLTMKIVSAVLGPLPE